MTHITRGKLIVELDPVRTPTGPWPEQKVFVCEPEKNISYNVYPRRGMLVIEKWAPLMKGSEPVKCSLTASRGMWAYPLQIVREVRTEE